ncbi:MAG: hydrolase [Patescibacteria group bacterium]
MEKKSEDLKINCCSKFNPEPWDEKEIIWQDKLFIKDSIKSFFHIPLNIGKVITKNMKKIEAINAFDSNFVMLFDEKSLWGADVFFAVNKDVPESEITKMSGTFLTKVFEGSYKDMGKWINEMEKYVELKGKKIEKMYFYYTTCPKCAKIYGKNFIVIFAKI